MANRSDRFSTLLPIAEFCNSHALIIGCGSIGAVIARTLCAMGVTNFTLVDPDTISHENLGTQGWRPGHLALPKVDALRTELLELNPLISCFTSTGKAPPIPDPPSGTSPRTPTTPSSSTPGLRPTSHTPFLNSHHRHSPVNCPSI